MDNNNNNNFFSGVDNLNNNAIPNSTPSTPSNNLNLPTQPQMNNDVEVTDGSIEGQFSNQNGNSLSNENVSETLNVIQPVVDNALQPSVNSVNEINSQMVNLPTQSQMNNDVEATDGSIDGQFSNQNGNSLSNGNVSETLNVIPPVVDNALQPSINSVNEINSQTVNLPTQSQMNNITDSIPQNNFQSDKVNAMSQQNVEYENQSTNDSVSINDEELLRSFIGNNYEKITTKPFNFAGFFFTTFYMFYRKMFLYAILLFLINLVVLNVINNSIVTFAFNVAVGFLVNKIYLFYAKKRIDKIKIQNPQKDINELKELCSTKGGTSVGKIFLGLLVEIVIAFVVLLLMIIAGIGGIVGGLFNPDNWDITNNFVSINNATLVEDVTISGYSCSGSDCNVSIEESGNYVDYVFGASNVDLFNVLDDYADYIMVNIYYTQKGSKKTIVDYKIYLKSNNEEITNVKTEDELRSKIGLYLIGTYTESFTLTEVGMTGFGFKDDKSYTYVNYTLVDGKNNEYEMKYIISDGLKGLDLVEGNTYTITFEVVEGTFGYEFYIKSVN